MKKTLFITFLILGIISFYLIPLPISARDVTETFRCYDSPQWHLPEGVKARIGKGSIIRLQYSPDGNVLAVMSSMGIWLYDAHSGEERALLSGHTGLILGMSFSPDSRIIASGGTDGTTRMWDIATGKQKRTLTVPRFRIGDVSFSPDDSKRNAQHTVILCFQRWYFNRRSSDEKGTRSCYSDSQYCFYFFDSAPFFNTRPT
ncbi:hypothetical protein J4G08_11525 [Candidatus Poribacteria bacterium]|nr:hypothetical protein [Candidatus Poribacteria bacterium]